MPEAVVRVPEFQLNPSPKSEFSFCKSMTQRSSDSLQCVYCFVHQRHVRVCARQTTCLSACTDFVGIAMRALAHRKQRGSGSG